MKRLYIGNLPWSVDNNKLSELFAKYSPVSALVIMDNQTGRSRGFGFVEIQDEAMANQAISEMKDFEVDGRKLIVNEARPREER